MIPVITYHSISPHSNITPTDFEEHLKFLVKSGYEFRFASEIQKLIESKSNKSKQIIITVDDGYYNAYEFIFPLLEKYGVKATVFLITSRIGNHHSTSMPAEKAHSIFVETADKSGFLNIENILEMQKSELVEFQSHSRDHLLHFSNNNIHSFFNPDLKHHWSLTYAAPFPLKTGMPLFALHPSLLSKRYLPSSELSEKLSDEAENILQPGNTSLKWHDTESKLRKKFLSLSSHDAFTDEHYEPSEKMMKRVEDDLTGSRLFLEEIILRKVTALSWPWGIYTKQLSKVAKD